MDVNLNPKLKFFETGKSSLVNEDKNIDMTVFPLLHIIDDSESKIKKEKLKSKWKVDFKMMDHFKLIESETPEKVLEMLYK